MAKFRIPTSILRIINLKDLYIFNLKLSSVTQSRSGTLTKILCSRLSSWRKTEDNHNENEKAAAHDARNHGILDWTSETFKEGSDNVGDTLVFGLLGRTSLSGQFVQCFTFGDCRLKIISYSFGKELCSYILCNINSCTICNTVNVSKNNLLLLKADLFGDSFSNIFSHKFVFNNVLNFHIDFLAYILFITKLHITRFSCLFYGSLCSRLHLI